MFSLIHLMIAYLLVIDVERWSLFLYLLRGDIRLDDGDPSWIDLSSATGKRSTGGERLAHEFGLIRTIE